MSENLYLNRVSIGIISLPGPYGILMKTTTLKIIASIVVVLIGCSVGVYLTHDETVHGGGILTVDFGNYNIAYGTVDNETDAVEALTLFCGKNGYELTFDGDGNVTKIDNRPADGDTRTWNLYTLVSENNTYTWKIAQDPGSVNVSSGTQISWGLCGNGATPTPVVDATGYTFYGMGEVKRIVCLAPSCTETVCALGGEDLIVGTDRYSNYPASVEQKRNSGEIEETGSYTSPSFETIVKLNPDLVIGIESQYSHAKTINKLREVGIAGIVTSDGEDLQSVYDNTYMVGVAMGLQEKASEVTNKLREQVEMTYSTVGSSTDRPTIMTALSSDKSPWVAGVGTYLSDIYGKAGAENSFDNVNGWRQVGAETIVKQDPQYILLISDKTVSVSDYEDIVRSLPEEWKSTQAFKDGNVYVFCDSASDMLSRPSTRLAQLTELLGRIFHQDSFGDSITVPYCIGDDYTDYITYSKEL